MGTERKNCGGSNGIITPVPRYGDQMRCCSSRLNRLYSALLALFAAAFFAFSVSCAPGEAGESFDFPVGQSEAQSRDTSAPGSDESGSIPIYPSPDENETVRITEVMNRNKHVPVGGSVCNWVELFNAGDDPVDLSDYALTDDVQNPSKAPLPKRILQPGEYYVYLCGGASPLQLTKDSTAVYLTKGEGREADRMAIEPLDKDQSMTPEGVSETPSPGYPNTPEGVNAFLFNREGLLINEVLSSNSAILPQKGEYSDLIELRNATDETILLSDYWITDKVSQPDLLQLPDETLEPGQCYTLILNGEAGEKLGVDKDGEYLMVVRASDGKISDSLKIPALRKNVSYGRSNGELLYFENPTFGEPNGKGFRRISDPPGATLPSGVYTDSVSVELTGNGAIYYTTDGSAPTEKSARYDGKPVVLQKTGTIRALCREPDGLVSDEETYTYFVNIPDYELPVLSVTVDPDAFFGSEGVWHTQEKTELAAHAAYFKDGREEFSVGCGVRLFGLGSVRFDKKSIQLKFKARYGCSKLKYDVFEDGEITSFDSLVVRAGGQGMWRFVINDEFVSSFIRDSGNMPSLLSQKYRPVNLYINGEYMGLYHFREKIDEEFLEDHTGYDEYSMSVVFRMTQNERGSDCDELAELLAFVEKSNLRDADNYRYLEAHFDMENIADYFLVQIWSGNIDTLNVRMYKSSEGDGRWRFILYDLDRSYYYNRPAVDLYLGNKPVTTRPYSGILNRLLKNDDFYNLFCERLELHVRETFDPDKAAAHLRAMMEVVDHDMHYEIDRWKGVMAAYPKSYDDWIERCEIVMDFLADGYNEGMVKRIFEVIGKRSSAG